MHDDQFTVFREAAVENIKTGDRSMDFSQVTIENESQVDADQATIDAFIQDEDDEEQQEMEHAAHGAQLESADDGHTNSNKPASGHGIFGKLGHIFKHKSNKKKKHRSSHHEDDNDDDNEEDADDNALQDADIEFNSNQPSNHDNNNNYNNYNNNGNYNNYNNDFFMQGFQDDMNAYAQPMHSQQQPFDSNEQAIMEKVGGALPWNCEKCTFLNPATELHCQMCFHSRFEVKNLQCQWQWKAADRWITYGIPETTEIEEAYKSGAKEVSLTKGWFAQNPKLYKICFEVQPNANKKKKKHHKHKHGHNDDQHHEYDENSTYFYQINSSSSTRREVRRIGADDENLFRKIALSALDDPKCTICQFEFESKDESEGVIVQLSTCKNHGFHKECIQQWVQLKGSCPLCRIEVDTTNQ